MDKELQTKIWVICDMIGKYILMNKKIKESDDYMELRKAYLTFWKFYEKSRN